MDMSLIKSRKSFVFGLPSLQSGLEKHFAGQTLTLDGVPTAVVDIINDIKAYPAALQAAATSRQGWLAQAKAADAIGTRLAGRVAAVRDYVRNLFGSTSTTLGDFGITPKKPATGRTTVVQAVANLKSAATRLARHTMSPKQKAQIHGVVPTTPQPAAPAPAAPSSPASGVTATVKSS
jgi:hypothetical protein